MTLSHETCETWGHRDFGYFHLGISDDTHRGSVEAFCRVGGQFGHGGFWNCEYFGIVGMLIFFPSQRVHHSGENAVGMHPMPVIVKAPDDQMVLVDEGALLGPDGVALVHIFGSVLVAEERGLMRDDQVLVIGGGTLQDVERSHHRYGNDG